MPYKDIFEDVRYLGTLNTYAVNIRYIDVRVYYWYKRTTRYNIFNHGSIISNKELNYRVDKRNLFWPVPNSAITANIGAQLRQNYGYDGYDDSVFMFDNWEDAVADEETAN